MRSLPTKGQRTKSNSRTVRGNVRKTMGSGKRKLEKKQFDKLTINNMGKKRIVSTGEADSGDKAKGAQTSKVARKRHSNGVLHIQSTYNNTKMLLTDPSGNTLAWSSSGSLGFKGAKKGTPFAAAKVGELIGDKAIQFGVKEADVIVKGVGAGRESSIRAFASKGINITGIRDATPVPHNGPKPPKPRRVQKNNDRPP